MIDRLLDYFSTLYLGIIGAIILHAALLFYFLFTEISGPDPEFKTGLRKRQVEVELVTQEEVKIQEMLKADPNMNPDDIRNITTSANDSRDKSSTDYSRYISDQTMEKELEEKYKELEEELFKEEQTRRDDRNYDIPDEKAIDVGEYKENVELRDNSNTAYSGQGMAHLDLTAPDRTPRRGKLRIPGYTGLNGGTITILIEVNPIGEVVSAEVDYTRTTVSETFAIEKALSYAHSERFNRNENAPKRQRGTITYVFKPQ